MEPEKSPFSKLKLRKFSIGEFAPHGELFQRSLSFGALRNLSDADLQGDLPASELVGMVIGEVVCTADDTPLSAKDVSALDANARQNIVRAIIEKNRDQFVEDRNEKGKGTDIAKLCVPMEQSENETDEEFLSRGIRAVLLANKVRLKEMMSGLNERTQGVIGADLAANIGASQSLAHLLDSMRPEPAQITMPMIPHNPIDDTNDLLVEVASQIGQMRDLAAATAEMQRTLNDTATAAVADFSAGTEKSFAATKEGLKVARITLGATILATFVSVVALGISIMSMNSQDAGAEAREAALRAQTERLMTTETELVRIISDLREEVEQMRADAGAREAAAKAAGRQRKQP